jgi:uncharacterized membrane protein
VFFKKKKTEKPKSTVDKLVTWIIIWGAVASMVGLSKTNKWKQITQKVQEQSSNVAKKWFSLLGKSMVWVLSIFNKKK